MVYCGKPSEACEPCRKRRIKCGRGDPCPQCSRKGIQCGGYQNRLDLSFRDETKSVIFKTQTNRKSSHRAPKDLAHSSSSSRSESEESDLKLVPQSLAQPMSEVALRYFINSYVPGSHFEYLPHIFSQASLGEVGNPITSSTYAAALANLARERQEPELMRTARSFYANALKDVNAAIRSDAVTADSTLASALVLSLFETIALEGQISVESWNTHTHGALSILKLRGANQADTAVGKSIYIQVVNNIRISCAQQSKPLPDGLMELDKQVVPFMDDPPPVVHFWPITDRMIELQIMDSDPNFKNPMEILRMSMEVDMMFVQGIQKFLEGQLSKPAAARILGDKLFKTRTHNTVRMARLVLNENVVQQIGIILDDPDEYHDALVKQEWLNLQQMAQLTAQTMADEILTSIPLYFGTDTLDSKASLNASQVIPLVWPLAAVGRSWLMTPEQRTSAKDILHQIGSRAKVPTAAKLAKMLNRESVPFHWLHMFHLA